MSSIRIFGHYVHTRLLLLGLVEGAIVLGAAVAGVALGGGVSGTADESALPRIAVMVAVTLFGMGAMGLYQPGLRVPQRGILLRIAASFVFGATALSIFFQLFPSLYVGPASLGVAGGAAFLGVAVTHLLFFRLVSERGRRRVLVLGVDAGAQPLAQFRRRADRLSFEVVGVMALPGERVIKELARERLLEGDVAEAARLAHADEIVVAAGERRNRVPMESLLRARLDGVQVSDVTSFVEKEAGKLRLETLHAGWLVFSEGARAGAVQRGMKRALDVVGALTLLLVAWPVMVAAAIAIRLDDGGPVLFRQVRVGLNGSLYHLVKFRSMGVDAERDGARWADKDDPRVTRAGALLRKTRIDELPQLWNVLKGEMSLVGPRPERPEFVADLAQRIPFYEVRHRVKPGLTGWAQLLYSYGASEQDAREKLQYDLYYVKNQSLFLDLLVLLQTVEVVLFGKGAR